MAENTSTASALTIGTLSSSDPDAGNTFSYSIVGGADQASFQISGATLQFKAGTALDYETRSSYAVTVRSTDQGGLSYDKALTITLTFSEALRTGEYAIGMDIAEAWETAWNADGTQMTLTVPADALNGQHTVNLIIFRLMDTDGNLIGGPVELHLDF